MLKLNGILRLTTLMLLLITLFSCKTKQEVAYKLDDKFKSENPHFTSKFEKRLEDLYKEKRLFGDFILAVVDENGLVYSFALNADILNGRKSSLNTDSPIYIASSTKAFTGTLLKILEEKKEIDLNKSLDDYLPQLCNANNPENLVKQHYDASAIYFNHKPIVKGVEDLIKEYDYMNNIKYHLNLQPIKLEVVNANFAYEIGQCSGSYEGKYILVWKKQSNGNWKIYIDSNI